MNQPLSFEFMLDEAEQVRVGRLVDRRRRKLHWWRLLGLTLVLVPVVCTVLLGWPLASLTQYLVALAVVSALALMVPLIQRWQVQRMFRESPALRGPLTYELKPSGFALRTPLTSAEVSWDAIREAIETPDMFVMFLTQRFAYYIPKRVIGSRASELRAFLADRLGDRAFMQHASSSVAVI